MLPIRCALPTAAIFLAYTVPTSAPAQWTNGQAAVNVVGQTGFDLSTSATTAAELNGPQGVCVDLANGKMYVADALNHRVLRFAYPIAANGPTAEAVFGQPSFTVNGPNNGGISASSLSNPIGVAVDSSGTLYVGDQGNNRLLVFSSAHLAATTGTAANRVLGQPNFITTATATTAAGMSAPSGCAFEAPDRLWVVDVNNNRVLRFDGVSAKANGAAADGVLGQPDFTSAGDATTTAGLRNPSGVAVHQGTLYVTDRNNNRVIRHSNAASKPNGANADGVLGQATFTSTGFGSSATAVNLPAGVAVDLSGRLYVADRNNSRLTVFDSAAGKANGAAADRVLGQTGFGTNVSGSAAFAMDRPFGVAVDNVNNRLIVAEVFNHRVTVFQASAPLPVAVSGFSAE
jgi:sugar lactone lactonase YvrE